MTHSESKKFHNLVKSYRDCQGGNIAMMFAFCTVMACIFIGAAVDGFKMVSTKTKLSAAVDAAALAGASAAEAGIADREDIVRSYLAANVLEIGDDVYLGEPIIVFDDDAGTVSVTLPSQISLRFSNFLGDERKPLDAIGVASFLKNNIDPVSISFALDVSGSMAQLTSDGVEKIEAVKSATRSLFTAIEKGSDKKEQLQSVLRSGMSTYNTELVKNQPMDWGWDSLEQSVDVLVADGGTNSTPALLNSYNQLKNDRAYRALDQDFDPLRLKEFVIFMTDGVNNQPEFDDASFAVCQDMQADGIKIYSVAFEAPEQGELLLLDCASPNIEPSPGQADPSKCMNAGVNGNGIGLGHCKKIKSAYYFDANDAAAFEDAFKRIGEEIIRSNVRLN